MCCVLISTFTDSKTQHTLYLEQCWKYCETVRNFQHMRYMSGQDITHSVSFYGAHLRAL